MTGLVLSGGGTRGANDPVSHSDRRGLGSVKNDSSHTVWVKDEDSLLVYPLSPGDTYEKADGFYSGEPGFVDAGDNLTLLLLTGIPYALTRTPFPLGMSGPVEVAQPISELTTRLALSGVALALAALAVAIALLATALALVPNASRQFLWSMWSLASVAYALGFGCYPVWLNGVMTASSRELLNELDPKHVAPFVWFIRWFDYPQWSLTFGMVAVIVFTPLVSRRVIIGLRQKPWSWTLALEAALPLAWICLHRPMLYAFAWSFD